MCTFKQEDPKTFKLPRFSEFSVATVFVLVTHFGFLVLLVFVNFSFDILKLAFVSPYPASHVCLHLGPHLVSHIKAEHKSFIELGVLNQMDG